MRILIKAASSWENAANYKSKLKDFKYEEVEDRGFFKTYIEINSLEDLAKLEEAVGYRLIVDFRKNEKNFENEPFIEIYDAYIE